MLSSLKDRQVGLYIHIPFCLSKCSYCDFFSIGTVNKVPDDYVKALCNEISECFIDNSCSVDTVYIGGGTPSLLSESQIDLLFSNIKEKVPLTLKPEITIELNPDDVSKSLLNCLWNNGVNRISCGIQSLADSALSFCHRRASSNINREALSILKANWRGSLSLDLIAALPEESLDSFIKGLEEIVTYQPDHISMYSLTIEDETPLGRQLSNGDISYDYEKADEMWISARDFLEKNAYQQYEVSNFCKAGKECLHNMKYWSRKDYLGCGCGATGTLYFPDGSAIRKSNKNDIKLYCDYWNGKRGELEDKLPFDIEEIDRREGVFEFFMMALRKTSGFRQSEYFEKTLPQNFLELINKWKSKGLAEIIQTENDVIYSLGKKGIIYLNSFLEELL